MSKRTAIISLIALGIISLGLSFAFKKAEGPDTNETTKARVLSFEVKKPNFEVKGENLFKVQISGIPTGTGMTEADAIKIGEMTEVSDVGGTQTWTLPIPAEPLLLTSISASALDEKGLLVGVIDLPAVGATSVYDLVWGNKSTENLPKKEESINKNIVLRIGESKKVADLNVRAVRIVEDSRCPVDVECIWAGRATVELLLSVGNESVSKTFSSDKDEMVTFKGYKINLIRIAPDKVSTSFNPTYEITINVSK